VVKSIKKVKKGKKQEQNERRASTFFRIVEEKLRPILDAYGLGRTSVEDPGGYTYYTIVFQNEQAGLRVYFEWRDKYLAVQLCRLVDGKVDSYAELLDSEWSCFSVEHLLAVYVPEYDLSSLWLPEEWKTEEVTMDEIAQSLQKYADAIRLHGGDILRGDFSVFPQLDKVAKQMAIARGAL
jgi:hypothetical protein